MTAAQAPTPTVILVHGAWFGPWAWDTIRERLAEAGLRSETVSLPSVSERLGGLADDVDAVRQVLDGIDGPVVLVGHSYGGLPVTEAAAGRDGIAHVVYVCAFAIPVGTTLLDAVGGQPPSWWMLSADDTSILPADPTGGFFGRCDPAVAADAVARLRPHSTRSVREPLGAAGYGKVPATYVVCTADALFPVEAQRTIAGLAGADVREIDTDHSPMLSSPTALAAVLADVAGRPLPAVVD
jgi:pimeloyl-ACP methyl ester carboxylesterase